MAERFGIALYWAFALMAVAVAILAVSAAYNTPQNEIFFMVAGGIAAAILYLIGRACRYVLAAH